MFSLLFVRTGSAPIYKGVDPIAAPVRHLGQARLGGPGPRFDDTDGLRTAKDASRR